MDLFKRLYGNLKPTLYVCICLHVAGSYPQYLSNKQSTPNVYYRLE